jgi:hypothetical protein
MNLTHPGEQLVTIGRTDLPPERASFALCKNSVPSSITVRSAAQLVSKTSSTPMDLITAAIFPVTEVPMGYPNNSPIPTRTAGAVWKMTRISESLIAFQTRWVWSVS